MVAWALEPLHDDLNTALALTRLRDLRTLENVASVGGSAATVLHRAGKPWPVVPGLAAAAFREVAEVLGLAFRPAGLAARRRRHRLGGRGDRRPARRPQGARLGGGGPYPRRPEGHGDHAGGRAAGDDLAAGMTGPRKREQPLPEPHSPFSRISDPPASFAGRLDGCAQAHRPDRPEAGLAAGASRRAGLHRDRGGAGRGRRPADPAVPGAGRGTGGRARHRPAGRPAGTAG